MKKILTDKILIFTLVVCLLLVELFSSKLLFCAIVANWIIFNCASIVVHEGWSHNYITPKNNIFRCILNVVACLTNVPSKYSLMFFWKETHLTHHRFWKDHKDDYVQWELNNNNWFTYIFTSRIRKKKNITYLMNVEQFRDKLNSIDKWFDKHCNTITIITHLILLVVLGITYYFYFVLLQIWLYGRQMSFFEEWLPHKHAKDKAEEHDTAWLFFYYGSNAYHVSHHRYINQMNLGSGWLKYFNIQYYFIKLFYNVNPRCKII